jgi:hypothetical protein
VLALDQQAVNACPQCGEGLTEAPAELLADATTGVAPTTGTEAGAQLPGALSPSEDAKPSQHPQSGGKDNGRPSTVNAPTAPMTIPSSGSSPSDDPDGDLGGLPTLGTDTGQGGGHQGGHQNGHGGGKGTDKPDLGQVTGTVSNTVTDTVNDVVNGVNGLINGVSGGQTGP